ncbi:flagellar hook-length control protein FliK [Deferribacter thermophilus]|uniref:flagellar hook-length control protein FliK n=1 Tax=Deferribacter thermophilus TaxID=53573 RepID=UPI003C2641F5
MEKMVLKMKQILPIDKSIEKSTKKVAKQNNGDFKKILTAKINEENNNKIANKKETELSDKSENINDDIDNLNVDIEMLKSILNILNINIDEKIFDELKTIKNYKDALQKIDEILSLKGFSENDIKKLFALIEEMKKEQFSDFKNKNLANIDSSLKNTESLQNIKNKNEAPTRLKDFENKFFISDKIDFNKIEKLEKFFHDILKSKEENRPVIRSIQLDLIQSADLHSDKQNMVKADFHIIKVEKPSDVLKFVDFIKLVNIKDGQKMVVKLHPAHLGNLKIELSEIAGKITAKLLVDNHEAKHLLMTNIDSIKQHLETKGIILADVELGYLHDDNNQGRFDRGNNGSSGNPNGRESFKIEETENSKENDSAIYA